MSGFLGQYGGEIAELTLEHVWLTGWAMALATAIAIIRLSEPVYASWRQPASSLQTWRQVSWRQLLSV